MRKSEKAASVSMPSCRVVSHEKLKGLPFNLETPNELPGYAEEIRMIREKTGEFLKAHE